MSSTAITKADVFSIANFVSLVGLSLTIFGALTINSLSGVLILGLGRFIDVFDGIIARRTHTSPFGALVDATCDKIGIAFLVGAVWLAELAPLWLLVYVLVQNIANVFLSGLTAKRGATPAASKYGKYAMFLQNIAIGLYALGNTLDNTVTTNFGLIVGITSMYFAIRATKGYFEQVPQK